ncbi:MAG: hypothetical protein RLY70_3596 [Planctomycetota bacterium]
MKPFAFVIRLILTAAFSLNDGPPVRRDCHVLHPRHPRRPHTHGTRAPTHLRHLRHHGTYATTAPRHRDGYLPAPAAAPDFGFSRASA